jgi:hypothetical protein
VVKKHDIKELNSKDSKASSLVEPTLDDKKEDVQPEEILGAESTTSINNSEL